MRVARFLMASALLWACAPTQGPTQSGTLVKIELAASPPDRLPDPELQEGHVGRAPRRLTVAQLKASILVATGRQWSKIDSLAGSLGQADYALINAESVDPNLVFAKFLDDAAREVCPLTAADDLTKPSAADRLFSREVPASIAPSAIDTPTAKRNLVYLSTRFWGDPLDEPELTTWAERFKAIALVADRVNQPAHAWASMCVVMMTDPRFVTY